MSSEIIVNTILQQIPIKNGPSSVKSKFQVKDSQVIEIANKYFKEMENLLKNTDDPLLKAKVLQQMKHMALSIDYRADKVIENYQRSGKLFQLFSKIFGCDQLLKTTAKTCMQKVTRLENINLNKKKSEKNLLLALKKECERYEKSSLLVPNMLLRKFKEAKQKLFLDKLRNQMKIFKIENRILELFANSWSITRKLKKGLAAQREKNVKKYHENLITIESLKCIKLFYSKVMDKSNIFLTTLQGQSFLIAIDSVHEDLDKFLSTNKHDSSDHHLLQVVTNELSNMKNYREEKNLSAKNIFHDLERLSIPKNDTRPDCVLIPSGSKTHAILTSVSRQPNGLYSLTLINTGEGSVVKMENEKYYTQEIIYTDLSLKELPVSFFVDLYNLEKETEDMQIINHFLDSSLGAKENRKLGRRLRMQEQGTCTMACLLGWLKLQLPKPLYAKFQVEMTQSSLAKAKEAVNALEKENLLSKHQVAFLGRETDECSQIFKKIFEEGEFLLALNKQKWHKYVIFPPGKLQE